MSSFLGFLAYPFNRIDHLLDRLIEGDPSLRRLKRTAILMSVASVLALVWLFTELLNITIMESYPYLQYLYMPAMLATFAYGRKVGSLFALAVFMTQAPFIIDAYLDERFIPTFSSSLPSFILPPLIYWLGLSVDRYRDYLYSKRTTISRLRKLSQRVMQRDIRLRMDLAGQIHDHLLQSMIAALFKLERNGNHDPKFSQELRASIDEIRQYVDDLRQSVPSRPNLGESLDKLVVNLEEMSGAKVYFSAELPKLAKEDEELVYQITKETTSNIWKHAHANYVSVSVKVTNGIIEVYVVDDGIGLGSDHSNDDSFGISIMKERVAQIRGAISIASGPKRGTIVIAKWRML